MSNHRSHIISYFPFPLKAVKKYFYVIWIISIFVSFNATAQINSDTLLIAPAKLGGLWGYINQRGDWIIAPQYGHANNFHENLAEVVMYQDDKIVSAFINIHNKQVIQLPEINYSILSEGMLAYLENNEYGYMDSTGRKVIPAQFKYCSNFENGKAMVVFNSGKAGYINKTKKLLISPRWDTAFSFQGKYAVVGKKDHHGKFSYGIIDQFGRHVLPAHFAFITKLSEGKAFANRGGIYQNGSIKGGKWYLLNVEKQSMLSLCDTTVSMGIDHYANYLKFTNGVTLFPTLYNKHIVFGLMNEMGDWVALPEYKIVNCINEDRAAVYVNGKMGYIDTKGKTVLPFTYDMVGTFHHQMAWFKEGRKFGFLNKEGEIMIAPTYDEVGDFEVVKSMLNH